MLFQQQQGSIYEETLLFHTKNWSILGLESIYKQIKGKFSDNLGQNICWLFHFLAQFVFTTSETELDYYHHRVNVRVAERLKTQELRKLGNFKEIPEILGFDGEYPATHPKAKF